MTSRINYSNQTLRIPLSMHDIKPLTGLEIVLIVIFIFGTIGNVLSIIVMRSKRMRSSNAAMFVIMISLLDTIYLLVRNLGLFYKKYNLYYQDTSCIMIKSMTIIAEVICHISSAIKL